MVECWEIPKGRVFYFHALVLLLTSAMLAATAGFIFLSESKITLTTACIIYALIAAYNLRRGVYLLILLLPLAARRPDYFGTANYSIAELFALVLLLVWLISILYHKKSVFVKTRIDAPLIVFSVLSVFSLVYSLPYIVSGFTYESSEDNLYPVKVLLNTLEYTLIFFLVTNTITRADSRPIVFLMALSLLAVSVYGIIEYNTQVMEDNNGKLTLTAALGFVKLNRIMSTFNHYNTFGAYLVLTIPVLLCYFTPPFNVLTVIPALISLVYSSSRGAVAGLFAGLLLAVDRRKAVAVIAVVLIVAVLAYTNKTPFLSNKIMERFLVEDDAGRFKIYGATLEAIRVNPQGVGLGAFRLAEVYEQHHAHNIFLQIAVERGLPALIVFIWLLAAFFRENTPFGLGGDRLRRGLVVGVAAFLVHGMVDYLFYHQRLALIFWMHVALVYVFGRGRGDSS